MCNAKQQTVDYENCIKVYELYLGTAEKVSDRRAAANTWMLSVNTAIISLYGYLSETKASVNSFEKGIWLWAIPLAGILVCVAWAALLGSYSKLNAAKFAVMQEIELSLPFAVFKKEQEAYKALGRRRLASIENKIPAAFVILYVLLLAASMLDTVWRPH